MSYLLQRMFDAPARVEAIICLAAMVTDGAPADPIRDLLDDGDDFSAAFPDAPEWLTEELGTSSAYDAFSEWVANGKAPEWVVKMATPVMRRSGSGYTYSWGHYRTRCFSASTFEDAVDAGLAWVANEKERAAAQEQQQ